MFVVFHLNKALPLSRIGVGVHKSKSINITESDLTY